MDREAFGDRPPEAFCLDEGLSVEDIFDRPDLTSRYLVKCRDDARGACLFDFSERDWIGGAEPSPRLFEGHSVTPVMGKEVRSYSNST